MNFNAISQRNKIFHVSFRNSLKNVTDLHWFCCFAGENQGNLSISNRLVNLSIENTRPHWTHPPHYAWENFMKRIRSEGNFRDFCIFSLSYWKITLRNDLRKTTQYKFLIFSGFGRSSRVFSKILGLLWGPVSISGKRLLYPKN